jgi:hypothetical protein
MKSKIVTNTDEYLSLFQETGTSQIKGEASTPYLFLYKKTIHNMSTLLKDIHQKKIIIILRNPVERAFSHYRMFLVSSTEKESFSNAIQNEKRMSLIESCPFYDYISPGLYYSQVKAYMSKFNNVYVCLYEDLKYNPQELIRNLYDFLNVDTQFTPNYKKVYNEGGVKETYRGMKGNLRRIKYYIDAKLHNRKLYPYPYKDEKEMYRDYSRTYTHAYSMFEKDIVDLELLIGRDLSVWNQVPKN